MNSLELPAIITPDLGIFYYILITLLLIMIIVPIIIISVIIWHILRGQNKGKKKDSGHY